MACSFGCVSERSLRSACRGVIASPRRSPRWVHRDFPRAAPPDPSRSLRSAAPSCALPGQAAPIEPRGNITQPPGPVLNVGKGPAPDVHDCTQKVRDERASILAERQWQVGHDLSNAHQCAPIASGPVPLRMFVRRLRSIDRAQSWSAPPPASDPMQPAEAADGQSATPLRALRRSWSETPRWLLLRGREARCRDRR